MLPQPTTLAELRLSPRFVADHCIRTLFYQGPMSPADLASHWHVHPDIAVEVLRALKKDALVELDAGQSSFERHARVRLTSAGLERVEAARSRTWYAGALPVQPDELYARLAGPAEGLARRDDVLAALASCCIDPAQADEIGQAVAAAATVALHGLAYDEQRGITAAIGGALAGSVALPYAVYSGGAVMRVVDLRVHEPAVQPQQEDDGRDDLLRSHETESQWLEVLRPVVALAGGVVASDVTPAFDEDARFYVAPAPFVASGGMLAVFDADNDPDAMASLARLWLVPGRHRTGIMMLRTGERFEVPWHAATLLFGDAASVLPPSLREALEYVIDVSALRGDTLRRFLAARMAGAGAAAASAADGLAEVLERHELATRQGAAHVARYLVDRCAYEGESFEVTNAVIQQAIFHATSSLRRQSQMRPAA